jgi:hypothetical protein
MTAIMAILTGLIALTGMYQAAIARDTARRQLRAYVHVIDVAIRDVAPLRRPAAHFNMQNTGQTPALDLAVRFSLALLPLPSEDGPFAHLDIRPKLEPGASRGTLGAGDTQPLHVSFPDPLPEQLFEQFKSGKLGIFLYGSISYRDVFRREQTTTIRFVHTAESRPEIMHMASYGNSAS